MNAGNHAHSADRAVAYHDNNEYLTDELKKLDLLIGIQVERLRLAANAAGESAGQSQMYISHERVEWLLAEGRSLYTDPSDSLGMSEELERFQAEIDVRVGASAAQGVVLFLPRLARLFRLSPFEVQAVLVCLAPELDHRYDTLYAYLQDDITRKKPTVDLVLSLLCSTEEERWRARPSLSAGSRLLRSELLRIVADLQSPSGSTDLANFLVLDPRILSYLLGHVTIDDCLADSVRLYGWGDVKQHAIVDQPLRDSVTSMVRNHFSSKNSAKKNLVFYFRGAYGTGRKALAIEVCRQAGCSLLSLDLGMLVHDPDFGAVCKRAFREALLQQAALYLEDADSLLDGSERAKLQLAQMRAATVQYGELVFMTGEKAWPPRETFGEAAFHSVEFPFPDVPQRQAAWEQALKPLMSGEHSTVALELAQRFRFTAGEIFDLADGVTAKLAADGGAGTVAPGDLYSACRSRSNQRLRETALKIEPRHDWADLVLPQDKIDQLQEICSQVRHHDTVFRRWGFGEKLSHGKGLSVLFSGPPGTGKTLAAEVIAGELGLDLYKIDLSSVVSKYVGETEKNLSAIFREAETSNSILFFDEADALFGKRTEVTDAHDRYANIETSYLLQRMEEYEGVVILATNLQENMDEAFIRRIRCIVSFPFPNAESRLRIWKTHLPGEAPVGDDIDLQSLSSWLQIAGGSIKNMALTAAFLAAGDGGTISMKHILRAARREFEKTGKIWQEYLPRSAGARNTHRSRR